MPAKLRETVLQEMCPVRPLLAPWKRLALVAPMIAAVLAMPFVYERVRDTSDLGMVLSWIPVAVQLLLAGALLTIALREGVPGWQVSSRSIFALVLSAYSLQIVVNLLIFLRAPVDGGGMAAVGMWMGCSRVESLIGLPILVLVAWLVSRALPCRPLLAGFLAGTGAGIAGEASWRMICPYSDPAHVLLGHTGGVLVLGLTGFFLGYLWTIYSRTQRSA
jgi:hypothetical protein